MHPILLNILKKVIVYQKPTGKQEIVMKILFSVAKLFFSFTEKVFCQR